MRQRIDEFEYLANILSSVFTTMELSAIWLERRIKTNNGYTRRIATGDLVTIRDGKITDTLIQPTHKILRCTGTFYGQFEIAVVELFTNELSQIKLSESCRQIN